MSPERYERLRELFFAVAERPPERRAAFLEQACPSDAALREQVQSLLDHDADPTSLLASGAGLSPSPMLHVDVDLPTDALHAIKGYRIIRKIADGGMGVVFEAEQLAPRRVVALKVVRPGVATPGLLRRFEYEGLVLARLHHPGIAQIHEVGTAQTPFGPLPFFAMEIVNGAPITRYARDAALKLPARLELLARVCDAVHHAHEKGIIHRDLKPSNILVSGDAIAGTADGHRRESIGQPKILDFGVARATDLDLPSTTVATRAGQLVGTIPYMSPEQAAGQADEIDTRSDVYALGVLGFELLTGRLPYDLRGRTIPEAVQIIRELEPPRLGELDRSCRGDIETVITTALQKDRSRRYESAAALAADLRRSVRDEPIVARPPSAMYQLRKLARRHRPVIASLGAAVLILLLGVAGTALGLVRAHGRHLEAEARKVQAIDALDEAEIISTYLENMLMAVSPRNLGRDVLVKDMLDEASKSVHEQLGARPLVAARVHETIGVAYLTLTEYALAEPHVQRSVELYATHAPASDPRRLGAMMRLAELCLRTGHHDTAERLVGEVLQQRRSLLGADHDETIEAMTLQALVFAEQARVEEAEALMRRIVDLRTSQLGPDAPETLTARNNLGLLLMDRAEYDEALEILQDTLERRQQVLGADDQETLRSLHDLGIFYWTTHRLSEAEPLLLKTLDHRSHLLGNDHADTVKCRFDLATVWYLQGESAKAIEAMEQVLSIEQKRTGSRTPQMATFAHNLGGAYLQAGALGQARVTLKDALLIRRDVLGDDHPDTINTLSSLGVVLTELRAYDDAERHLLEAAHLSAAHILPNHPRAIAIQNNLGSLYREQSRFEEAERVLSSALDRAIDALGEEHALSLDLMNELAITLRMTERFEEAQPLYERVVRIRTSQLGADHPRTMTALNNLGVLLARRGNLEEASPLVRSVLENRRRVLGREHPRTLDTGASLARLCIQRGLLDEAERLIVEVISTARSARPDAVIDIAWYELVMGELLIARGSFEQAEQMLQASSKIVQDRPASQEARKASELLARLYEAWEREDRSEALRTALPN